MGGESPVKFPLSKDPALSRSTGGADLEKKTEGVKASFKVISSRTGQNSPEQARTGLHSPHTPEQARTGQHSPEQAFPAQNKPEQAHTGQNRSQGPE